MKPIVLGGLAALAALGAIAMSSSKKPEKATKGETWHYVYSIYPDLKSQAESDALEAVFRGGMAGIATVNSYDASSNPNTIDVEITYITPPAVQPEVGSSVDAGGYTVTLAHKDRVA